MELVKAVPLGAILTLIVALTIGSQGSRGGQLAIFRVELHQFDFWWSWPLFIGGTALAWGIMLLQR
ncbi:MULTISPECIES: hypothetical protein [Erythrobacter]|uniref:Uncharacterized protein n=1 Tax=Erythrobacter aureus TaxID=2182384 RepID=A0A345YBR1_9SPHN|nr:MULTISPECIES: hypothetical protein [Erythrobacter]AXK41363.1 hypothetical protein DVR09_02570 [Erythrobacter aureus]MBL45772.1 hypothetical protein [Sphingomonadaceae bacterium]MCF8882976.1 hypothetical protein [Erythrobacter sp. SN021]|tara:strand:+ start:432 stop:629 length:198 start_codon:yes stop_codon:yes gene_type:complete